MPHIGLPELIVILVILMLIFGAGRLKDIGGALGQGIKAFKKGIKEEEKEKKNGKA